jgi:DNA-binding NtrC family response regulator
MTQCERPDGSSSSGVTKRLNVLVVEDDFGDYDAAARALRKMVQFEAHATRARSIEAARRAIADTAFDVYLVDMNLGVESGSRFLKESGGRNGHGVAIVLTGLLNEAAHDLALQSGAVACLSKQDLSPRLLETTIRSALHTKRVEAEYQRLVTEMSSLLCRYRGRSAEPLAN